MRKKKIGWGILVFLLTLVFIVGCNNDDETDDEEPFPKNDAVLTFKLEKNEYSNQKNESKGNQEQLSFTDLNTKFGSGLAIPVEGEKYTLKFKFFSDKDVAAFSDGTSILISLIDTHVNSNGIDTYWFRRSQWDANVASTFDAASIKNVKKNTLISFIGTFTVTAPSTASGAQAGDSLDNYKLVFDMGVQPWNDEATLYFQSFEFKRN